ncbi:LADA_0D07668g1_1 [Lachancea dasiensis]|uniref:LADA_0D07668g1_1 n=1 Tax=Lachancea dasiensis TaxID=1072105 RepID=A0A1G4J6K5_9SACH|nr:LADA_0D07668g1_1 [Lachancea dasiensis]
MFDGYIRQLSTQWILPIGFFRKSIKDQCIQVSGDWYALTLSQLVWTGFRRTHHFFIPDTKMKSLTFTCTLATLAAFCLADSHQEGLDQKWGQDWPFSGIQTYAHLPHAKCLLNQSLDFDIGIIGMPFDTAVSYRPGARFGPQAIRRASERQTSMRGFNFRAGVNPYQDWAKVLDCGDVPVTPMDNHVALEMMGAAFEDLLSRNSTLQQSGFPPRFVTLGGDHSIILPVLRQLHKVYGPISVIHFDSHLDTWAPTKYPSYWHSDQCDFTHGSMLWLAKQEGLLSENSNVHAGLRTRLSGTGWDDYEEDDQSGFHRIECDEILQIGAEGMAEKILKLVPHDRPVYISVDIDVLDPSAAPGTGTVEVGGLLTRELIHMIRRLEKLPLVGADIVEVSPAYDHADITALAASQVAYELITNMVKGGPIDPKIIAQNRPTSTEWMLKDETDFADQMVLQAGGN